MKIKDGYLLDSIGGQAVAVPLDYTEDKFSGMIKLNSVGAFLWENLLQDIDEDTLVQAVTKKYDVDSVTAQKDVRAFLEALDQKGVLEK